MKNKKFWRSIKAEMEDYDFNLVEMGYQEGLREVKQDLEEAIDIIKKSWFEYNEKIILLMAKRFIKKMDKNEKQKN